MSEREEEHGLVHSHDFLSSLPVLLSRPAPHTPIRQLSAAQFADIHLRSQLAHAPDSVIFPFLHGLEGDNDAQNSFFATGYTRTPDGHRGKPKLPHFRGLVWVAVEEDMDDYDESEDEDYDDFASDMEPSPEPEMNEPFAMDMDHEPTPVEATFMHPVQNRIRTSDIAFPDPHNQDAYSPHQRSSTTSSTSSAPPSPTFTTASYSTLPSSYPPSPVCDSDALQPFDPNGVSADCVTPIHATANMIPRLTSTFKARELLMTNEHGEARFVHVRVPDGISLRNFGIQVPIYATLSDIVVYSRRGAHRAAFALAEKFKQAVEAKLIERTPVAPGEPEPVHYNVFVLSASPEEMLSELSHALVRTDAQAAHTDSTDAHVHGGPPRANTVNFAQREKDEMRDLTRASEILSVGGVDARAGRVFLGNSNDVPLSPVASEPASPWAPVGNDPAQGTGYDICIECHDRAPVPAAQHLRAAEEHLAALAAAWARAPEAAGERPAPHPSAVVHLPFPSSPGSIGNVLPFLEFLERILQPTPDESSAPAMAPASWWPRRGSVSATVPRPAGRGARVLVWSSDGYTESSVLALCLLMAVRRITLAEAYLELQVTRKRSFFVYTADLGILRRVDAKLARDRAAAGGHTRGPSLAVAHGTGVPEGRSIPLMRPPGHAHSATLPNSLPTNYPFGLSASASLSSLAGADEPDLGASAMRLGKADSPPTVVPSQRQRPRASTSPLLPSLVADHQVWFDDPRFDGSFPSRVLPFLYLGNLNHASNAYMLHALGITHVVSVGECALVPPPELASGNGCAALLPSAGTHAEFVPGKGPGRQGSLWIEEREGRIKVLDIKGVCDDGIDTLEPQLEPICDWIEKARREGGQVLVHCRVGVSRSATVTIAYVMKHLNLPLVDAYLIVRSRRLSVLIQPNMRLLYNLCGWEVKLARERAGDDPAKLRNELTRTLSWPYLAREVHALNEKYLR